MTVDGERRLSTRGIERATPEIHFSFEGERIGALEGETIAAALTAAGILHLREATGNMGRGLFCGMGTCQDCLVEIDGRGSQRACMTKVAAGLDVRRGNIAAGRLLPLGSRPAAQLPTSHCDVAIVGAGPAALAAARILAEAELCTVLLDERDQPGGQYFKPLAPSHRFSGAPVDPQFAEGDERRQAALAAGAEIRSGALVWKAVLKDDGIFELAIHSGDGATLLTADRVLLATGAYEAPLHVPGWTLPGVMTAGAAQTLARAYRVSPGRRVLVAGNGPLNWQVALDLVRGGADVVAVLESARPTRLTAAAAFAGMARAAPRLAMEGLLLRARLGAAGIPVHEGVTVTGLFGAGQVQTVHAMDDRGGERRFAADAVSLGYGFIPAAELARHLGAEVSVNPHTGFPAPIFDRFGRTSIANLWVAGDGAGIRGSQVALARGELAAMDMLGRAAGDERRVAMASRRLERADRFQDDLWRLFRPTIAAPAPRGDTLICRCEGVSAADIGEARADGVTDLGSLKRRTRLGMGRCQGRYCAGQALKLLRGTLDGMVEADLFAPRAPVRPIPAIALAVEKGEWGGHRQVPTETIPRGAHTADPLPASCDLLVIGAGIAGASTAMHAARHGMDVVVVDRSAPNSQASGGNAGSLHVQLLSWDFGSKAMAGGSPAQHTLPLQRDAVALWKALQEELHADFEIVTTGGLMVAEDEAQSVFLREKAAAERAVGIDTEVIGRDELARLAPSISDRMVVAAYCAAEGKINPLKATPAIVSSAKQAGARFAAGHQVVGIERSGARYRVHTAAGASISTARIVIAAGGWTRQLGRMLGCELPISGAPLQMLVTEPTRPLLRQLVAHADRHLTMKQASNGNLIIGGAWPADMHAARGYSRVLRDSIEGNLWVAERTVPAVSGLHLLRSWAAMNIDIDGAPLLGPLPGHPAVFVVATANGYTLGPMVGLMTADLVTGRTSPKAIDYFTLSRFG